MKSQSSMVVKKCLLPLTDGKTPGEGAVDIFGSLCYNSANNLTDSEGELPS